MIDVRFSDRLVAMSQKCAILLPASLCIRVMSNFALAHARKEHQARWNTLFGPQIFEHQLLARPNDLMFFASCMAFTALAYAYYRLNETDNHQRGILVSAAMTGLVVALGLDLGLLIGIFGAESWFIVLGLVVSDMFHGVCLRRSQASKWYEQAREGWEKA